jgi:hypothetical protein
LAALLIVGAALELAGIVLVALDVWDARRTLIAMSSPQWQQQQTPEQQSRSLFALMAETAAGNIWRRGLGAVLFACGLVLQTLGNLL